MSAQTAFVPSLIQRKVSDRKLERVLLEVGFLFFGFALVTLLAQVTLRLPWTPIPVTGQTFGVALVALLWGRNRAGGVLLTYLAAGSLGVPVFAGGTSYLTFTATGGYLFGMIAASALIGELADRGWTKTWGRAFLAAASGSAVTFTCGLLVLSYFVPADQLLMAGFLPFIPGDLFKNALASFIATRVQRA